MNEETNANNFPTKDEEVFKHFNFYNLTPLQKKNMEIIHQYHMLMCENAEEAFKETTDVCDLLSHINKDLEL